ncbi:MAG: 50S ribosomal protein L10 [archaeon]
MVVKGIRKSKSELKGKGARVSENKKKKIAQSEELAAKLGTAKSILVVELKNTPGAHISHLRKIFGEGTEIVVRKKAVIEKAIEAAAGKNPSFSKILPFVQQAQPALILSTESPFKLRGAANRERRPARAKIGQVSDREIIVLEGDTGLPPGPAIGDLQKADLPAKIQKGKIIIEKSTVVARPGDVISKEIADALLKLGIEPFETDINILVALEGGLVYGRETLGIDEAYVLNQIIQAHSWAFNLAVEAGYPTADTVELLVQRAVLEAASLAFETKTVPGENIGEVLAKA